MLTDSFIKKVKLPPTDQKTPDKYSDAFGLQLHVFANGAKYWRMAFRFEGTQKIFSIGKYPDITLAQARIKRDEAKALLKQGINPTAAKKESKNIESGALTFEAIANQWLADRKDSIEESSHKRNVRHFVNDVFPIIGKKPISCSQRPRWEPLCLIGTDH